MSKSANIEITDNGGYIVRIYPEWDRDGNQTEKEKIEVFTDLKGAQKFLEKNLKSEGDST